MNLERAFSIPGWMEKEELHWLARKASYHTAILEVGGWFGRSTRAMVDNTSGTVTVVDTWRGSEEHQKYLEEMRGKGAPDSWIYDAFCSNFREEIPNKVVPVVLSSLEAAARFTASGFQFDMIFFDGSHDFESVCADIKAWRPLLTVGGLLCGHDYGDRFPGVWKAVTKLVPDRIVGPGRIWHT